MSEPTYCLGIDFGTSGVRAIAIDRDETICQSQSLASELQTPQAWRDCLWTLLAGLDCSIASRLQAIAINGTSGTVLLCDREGRPLSEPLLYNDARGQSAQGIIVQFAPANHLVNSATSSLAKLLWLQANIPTSQVSYFLHQADWLAGLCHGQWGTSDYHNALKLGYDPERLAYPVWLTSQSVADWLPRVAEPGQPIGLILPSLAQQFQLNPHCQICAGTTDSIAAFLASGASQPGEAVTSLGSTLVLKLLGDRPISNLAAGVYSHRFGKWWLVGGASNTGGAVLQAFFDDQQLVNLSAQINPHQETNLDYYPLLKPGDRFPINDPHLTPRLSPRPDDPVIFLQGLLESIARIEALGYRALQELGGPNLRAVMTAGGGAKNPAWTTIRQRYLPCPVTPAPQLEAAFGTALLAKNGLPRH